MNGERGLVTECFLFSVPPCLCGSNHNEHIEGFDLLPKRVEILGFFRYVNAFGTLLKRVKNLILF